MLYTIFSLYVEWPRRSVNWLLKRHWNMSEISLLLTEFIISPGAVLQIAYLFIYLCLYSPWLDLGRYLNFFDLLHGR
jgi:hypothetical protein